MIFKDFLKGFEEPKFFRDLRKSWFDSMLESEIVFKHGTNISLIPDFNFDSLNFKSLSNNIKIISADDCVSVSNSITVNEKEFFTSDWLLGSDKLSFMNLAFANDFFIINVPDNVILGEPIFIDLSIQESAMISNVLIKVGYNSEARFIIKKSGGSEDYYFGNNVRVIALDNSNVEILTLQELSKGVFNVSENKAMVSQNAVVNWFKLCSGSDYSRSSTISFLNGIGAISNQTSLFLSHRTQMHDLYNAVIHNQKNSYSNIVVRGLSADNAKSLSRAFISIGKNASGSKGFEKQNVLVLSSKAEANAIPKLEINTNDVKCSHAASIGRVDEDKLFYLMSRGLTSRKAKKVFVKGFFNDVLGELKDKFLIKSINNSIKGVFDVNQ